MASRKLGIGAKMQQAALELYAERGTLRLTAAEIASRAGTTERTFFRHFADKLDAFFGDETRLRILVSEAVMNCPEEMPALAAALQGFHRLAADFDANREELLRRHRIISAHAELQSREMQRSLPWADVLRNALHGRAATTDEAELVAALALTIFRTAYQRWAATRGMHPLGAEITAVAETMHRQLHASLSVSH